MEQIKAVSIHTQGKRTLNEPLGPKTDAVPDSSQTPSRQKAISNSAAIASEKAARNRGPQPRKRAPR